MSQKIIPCKACGKEIAATAKTCPECGAKNEKPFYKRGWFIFLAIVAAIIVVLSIGGNSPKDPKIDKDAVYRWPDSTLVNLLPKPISKNGKVNHESENRFSIDVYDVSADEFEDYVEDCKDSGFVVDYSKTDSTYYADDESGNELSIFYDPDEEIMGINLAAFVEEKVEKPTEDTSAQHSETTEQTQPTTEKPATETMRSDFKAAMDAYENFMNEYVAFMKKYAANPGDMSLLMDYTNYMSKYAEFVEDFSAWESTDMNMAESVYYLEVQNRVAQKLLEVAY